jgi:hypothetical protein
MDTPRHGSSRRAYLAALASAGVAGLAGCAEGFLGADDDGDDGSATPGPTPAESATATVSSPASRTEQVVQRDDVELPVARSELNRGARKDGIPAITEPAFAADWSGVDASLPDDRDVIGVVRGDRARAYPLAVLDWHEIVNDEFGGPLLVTYCPLCGSAMTAERRVAGEVTTFGVSGLLWKSDLVMYDAATESYWSQILATAIRGERTGDALTLVPSTTTTWAEWRAEHPDTEVLVPPPESETITGAPPAPYGGDAYPGYDESTRIGIGFNEFDDDRLHPKAEVLGVATDDAARAYPLERVLAAGVINDTVGDVPVVVTTTAAASLVSYVREVDGETVAFEAADERHLSAVGSRWRRLDGTGVDGPHAGARLAQANTRSPMFWFAWLDFNTETTVYGES